MSTHRMLLCLSIALLLICAIPAFAQQTDQKPAIACFMPDVFLENKIPMVALVPMAEVLEADLTVDLKAYMATVTRKTKSFTCSPGKTDAIRNGEAFTLPCPTIWGPDSVFVPLIPMIEALGGKVEVIGENNRGILPRATVTIPDLVKPITLRVDWFRPNQKKSLPYIGTGYYAVGIDGSGFRAVSNDLLARPYVTFSPDGKYFYYRVDYHLFRRAVDGHTPEAIKTFPNYSPNALAYLCYTPCVDPDGGLTILAKGRMGKNYNDPITETQIVRLLPDNDEKVIGEGFTPCVSPNGRLIAVTVWDTAQALPVVRVMNADGTGVKNLGIGASPMFSPDGKYLAWLYPERAEDGLVMKAVVTWPVGGDAQARKVITPGNEINSDWMRDVWGDFNPAGTQLTFVTGGGKAWVVNVDGTDLHALKATVYQHPAFFTRDGKSVVAQGYNALLNIPLDGGQPKEIVSKMFIFYFVMMPDRQHVFFTGEHPKP